MRPLSSVHTREKRLLSWFKEIGSNVGTLGREIQADVSEAAQSSDPIKWVMAPIVGAARLVLKAPTYVGLGVLDKKVEAFNGFETGHTISETGREIGKLHPLRAAVHAINLIDSAILDTLRGIGGYQGKTRAQIAHTMAA